MLPSEIAKSNLPRRGGYDWAGCQVTHHFSKYRWSSMVETYATRVPMFTTGKTSTEMYAERYMPIDNVCHGQEGHGHNFFYIYPCMFTNYVVRLPFDKFTMDVLCTLNVGPTQLHPNSWASLHAFWLLVEMIRLRPSLHVYLSYYSARPSGLVK